ncbi:MAG TPA: nucleotidyltransferase domain-containing protein [Bdellovibrionota bacterium]|nr:nucleotidyltransferase domain-containing protein [Bdellovibrionota bacterium]
MLTYEAVVGEIRERILPGLDLPPGSLHGAMVYGSRVSGGARVDSDLDCLAWVERDGRSIELEYHGFAAGVPLELRIQSRDVIRASIEGGEAPRIHALARSVVVFDEQGALEEIRGMAAHAIVELPRRWLESIGTSSSEDVLALIRISIAELRQVTRAASPMVAAARALEFLSDFHLYVSALLALRAREAGKPGYLPWTAMLSGSARPARVLDTSKFTHEPWFTELLSRLGERGAIGGESWFAAIAEAFEKVTGEELFPSGAQRLEVWIRGQA